MISIQNDLKKHKRSKLVASILLLTIVFYVFFNSIYINKSFAVQIRESISDKLENYPGYSELINKLKQEHPNWKFTIFYTGLDWNQVIKMETTACHGRNVVPANRSDAWKCSICGDTPRGGSSWRCASEATVSYYMDPRNWLNDTYIFEFENLSYNDETQKIEGVEKIISDMQYMQGEKAEYTDTQGNIATLEKSYAQIIMDAAKEAGISPYHLASRIRQEQGAGSKPGSTATGTYNGYVGYYNYLNIKASGSTDKQVIVSGLEHAKANNWTNPEISIKEGAKVLAKNYIKDGQDTLYLQKFDVDNSDGTLYYFQYMQNVSASVTEGVEVRKTYEQLGLMDNALEFIIPVYENMPDVTCKEPVDASIVTQNVKVKGMNVNVRSGPGITYSSIGSVNTGDILLMIEKAYNKIGNYYWDKVVLPDGKIGYMARNYLVEIEDITNCEETVIVTKMSNLRNGPGIDETSVITVLTQGQAVTKIETGKYNLNGEIWERIKLSDGRQGYVPQSYIKNIKDIEESGEEIPETEIIKVICKSGLKVREAPGTDSKVLTYLENSEMLTRIEKDVLNTDEEYIWDKIVTLDGIEGYIARGTSKEQYIEVIEKSSTKEETEDETEEPKKDNIVVDNKEFKVEDKKIICTPSTTIETIKEKNTTAIIKNPNGEIVTSGNIGTGYKIIVNETEYTVIKKGDANGDTTADAIDLLLIKRHLLNTNKLKDCYAEASDLNKDGKIDAIDLLLQKRELLGTNKISIN